QAVQAAQSGLQTAQSTLEKLVSPNPGEVAQLQTALEAAQGALEAAQTTWERLVNHTDLALSPEATALKNAQSTYQSALASYQLKASGPKGTDVSSAQAAISSAQAALEAAQAQLADLEAGAKPSDLEQQRQAVTQLQLALQSAQSDLDNAVLRAPYDGVVTAVSANPGDQVSAGAAVVTLVDPNLVTVTASLDESSVARVKPGQSAIVTFDALPGQTFPGTVTSVTPAGVTQQGVVTFPVMIAFTTRGVSIPAGLSATIRVVVERKDGVLAVPSRALKRQGNQTTVDVVQADGSLHSQGGGRGHRRQRPGGDCLRPGGWRQGGRPDHHIQHRPPRRHRPDRHLRLGRH